VKAAQSRFGCAPTILGDLVAEFTLVRFGEELTDQENAIFIPFIGTGDVVHRVEDMTLRPTHYARLTIKADRSCVRFVAQYLNSELGRATRESAGAGGTLPKLNRESLLQMPVYVLEPEMQQRILAIEGKIAAEATTLSGLQNEIGELRRNLWSSPREFVKVEQAIEVLSTRLPASLKHSEASLEQWFETLPFPMASILRRWQATSRDHPKDKYEALLDFFEATAEFVSAIMLSAFTSDEALFAQHEQKPLIAVHVLLHRLPDAFLEHGV